MRENYQQNMKGKNARKIATILRKAIIKSAHTNIGKKKVGSNNNKPWLTKDIKSKIKERNELRRNINSENREKWLKLCREVNDDIREEKTRLWHEYVSKLDMRKKPKEVWRTIRNLDGKNPPSKANEALIIGKDAYTDDKDKANEFAKTYKSFSVLPVYKEDRKLRRAVRKEFKKVPVTPDPSECDIKMEELERNLKQTNQNKAAGEDQIPYEFLKHLGPKAKRMLLCLYNKCWRENDLLEVGSVPY